QIFQPLYELLAWIMAFFYAVIPNFAVAIALLTVVVMIVTAPLTVKSTKSMVAMQRLSPELKKIQQKYKGDRQTLNEEMMKLYKEHGVNPAGGCLPMVAQFPVFIILYGVIKGLANTVTKNAVLSTSPKVVCHQAICALPRYIGTHTKLYQNLVKSPGKINAFGINLADKVLGHHSVTAALPYAALILIAIGLQYFQMRQLNNRNPQFAQSNPQAQMMQRYMPLIFAVIYINIAAGVNVYFIVSSLCRIGIQEAIFRSGTLNKAGPAAEGVLPSGRGGSGTKPRRRPLMERLADMQKQALEQKEAQQRAREALPPADRGRSGENTSPPPASPPRQGSSPNGASRKAGKPPAKATGGAGPPKANGQSPPAGSKNTNGANSDGAGDKKPTHPRSKTKRERKDR
ncbi:MAG TPA: membrane protein insertase YidC, partial [Acidimicrobiales bacterium]|nr:membrane protein insertase YidC [Acidimicrobiales bacterium]